MTIRSTAGLDPSCDAQSDNIKKRPICRSTAGRRNPCSISYVVPTSEARRRHARIRTRTGRVAETERLMAVDRARQFAIQHEKVRYQGNRLGRSCDKEAN